MKVGLYLPFPPSVSSLPPLLFQVALETLLLRGPQKPQTHPLADYRYTGDWSRVVVWFLPETPMNQSALMTSSVCTSWSLCLPFQKGQLSLRQLSGCHVLLVRSHLSLFQRFLHGPCPPQKRMLLTTERWRQPQVQWLNTPPLESSGLGPPSALGQSQPMEASVATSVKWG